MIERVVDNWLINAVERQYEVPLAQVLALSGHEILQGPVHHAHEQGKDIITRSPDGKLWALQLKSGNIDLGALGLIEPQLWALSHYPVKHPGFEGSMRMADRVFLVTNGALTPPAKARISDLSAQFGSDGVAPIEYIEHERLLGMFVRAHGRFLPCEPEDMRHFLEIYLDVGDGPMPKKQFAIFLDEVLSLSKNSRSSRALVRAIASATMLVGYAVSPWARRQNHLGVAEGWLLLAAAILRIVEKQGVRSNKWLASYRLSMEAARTALEALLREALNSDDLVIPDLTDALVYGCRVLLVCGYCAALGISEVVQSGQREFLDSAAQLIQREMPFAMPIGEAAAPYIIVSATALELAGGREIAVQYVSSWLHQVASENAPGSRCALADPYHDFEEVLFEMAGGDTIDEEPSGGAYTLHIAMEWLARRGERDVVNNLWPAMARVTRHEFIPALACDYLARYTEEGNLKSYVPGESGSWAELQRQAQDISKGSIPAILWNYPEYLPYLPLLFPYRLTADLAKALDEIVRSRQQASDSPATQSVLFARPASHEK